MTTTDTPTLRLALPKGRMQDGVLALLSGAGVQILQGHRDYRPAMSLPGFEVKMLKPQNIVEMLHAGSRDLGFAGADWVAESGADLAMLIDTHLDPVQLVAAAPENILEDGVLPQRPLVVASEYNRLTRSWIDARGCGDTFVHTHGATEVFPPEDADCIIDNTATGATLKANGLVIIDELMTSSTRLYANPGVLENTKEKDRIDGLVLLLQSVIEARTRVLLEVNVSEKDLEAVLESLPCMREPTIAPLRGSGGYAVRVAVPRDDLPRLVLDVKARGGTDLIVTQPSQIVP